MKPMIRISFALPAIAALAFVASCGSDSATETSTSAIDLSAALSATTIGDPASLPGASSLFGFPDAGVLPSFDPTQCPYSAASQSFVCPTRTQNGLTFAGSFMLLDASGHSESSLDASATTAVRAIIDVTGHPALGTSTPTPTAAINHHSDLTLSGLTSSARTLNGTSRDRDTVTAVVGSATTKTTIDATSTTTNLVLPANGSKYPASGTITMDLTVGFTANSSPTVTSTTHAVITFNGTSVINIAITTSGTTRTCQIDLTNGIPHCNGA
jgi:hypothetical protein